MFTDILVAIGNFVYLCLLYFFPKQIPISAILHPALIHKYKELNASIVADNYVSKQIVRFLESFAFSRYGFCF